MAEVLRRHKREFLALFRMMFVFAAFGWVGIFFPNFSEVVYQSIRDAYVGVTVWVALTLAIFYFIEGVLKIDFGEVMQKHTKWQVAIGALLGGLPGCGGAIVVVTQYVKGKVSFGALVAALAATMGDAAFLIIAAKPKMAIIVITLGIVAGIITGWIVDKFPEPKWLAVDKKSTQKRPVKENIMKAWFWAGLDTAWYVMLIPGLVLTLANSIQADANQWFSFVYDGFADDMSVVAGVYTLCVFFASPSENNPMDICPDTVTRLRRVVAETGFISAWVASAFLLYDITMYVTGWDLKALFSSFALIAPLVGVIIGWLPGCGPQIVVTTLYINGIIPFSALMGNAISNDGDALFPALAIAPRAGIMATLYSTVPAIIIAYGIYFLFEA